MKNLIILFIIISSMLYPKEICIENFKKRLCSNFSIMPSIIIKTKLSKKQLADKLKKKVTLLATFKESNLFLIKENNPIEYIEKLQKKEFIIYAQPNILQARKKLNNKNQSSLNYKLKKVWNKTKGKGVKIAIIDDGFNLNHEDLKNTKVAFEYDVENKILNASSKNNIDIHGTKVAGIIFAQNNNIGIDGISPEAELIAIRQTSTLTSDTILAFTVANLAKADIINCSWNSSTLLEPIYDVIVDISKNGREGKGTAIVVSAGNSSKKILPYMTEASIPEVVVVGAREKYSNYGELVDIVIPSGRRTTVENNGYGFLGGTSSVAPIVSGIMALILAQDRSLTLDKLIVKTNLFLEKGE